MATHDYDLANNPGATFRSDLNSALQAIVSNNSSASAPSTTFAYMWWADTTSGWLKQRNSANTTWVKICLLSNAGGTRIPVQSKGSNYTVVESDFGSLIRLTSSITLSLTSTSSLEDGWNCEIRNDFTSPAIVNPSTTSQTIDGASSMIVMPGDSFGLRTSGSLWHTVRGGSTFLKDDGNASGPQFRLFRDSASPVSGDNIGLVSFDGRDGSGNYQPYLGYIYTALETVTNSSESANLRFGTTRASATGDRLIVGAGIYTPGQTDPGSGAIAASTAVGSWVAARTDIETPSSTSKIPPPAYMIYHPGIAKGYCKFNGTTAGTNAPTGGYNVTNITRNSAGNYTVNHTNGWISPDYIVVGAITINGGTASAFSIASQTNSTTVIQVFNSSTGAAVDAANVYLAFFGYLA